MEHIKEMVVSRRYLEEYPFITIGLNSMGSFVVSYSEINTKILDEQKPLVGLLPLLELDFIEFSDSIQDMVDEFNKTSEHQVVNLFPFNNIVITALTSDRSSWIELSFDWLKCLGRDNFSKEIGEVISNKRINQNVRHAILKL